MAFLIATPTRDAKELAGHVRRLLPDADVRVWPDLDDPAEIEFALVWKPPRGLFGQLPNLRAVSSLGAGVDELVASREIPERLAIGRLAGPRLAANMAAYLVSVVVAHWKRLPQFIDDQAERRWNQWAPEKPPAVGLLGLGEMGRKAAEAFAALDFPLLGWSRSGNGPEGVSMFAGTSGLAEIAGRADYLVNLLPLTAETRDILDRKVFENMRRGSTVVNVGRGEHLVDHDLLEALDAGRPGYAILDVFREEPLPDDHPFWRHPKIFITPHCASITLTVEAAELAAESYRRVMRGESPLGMVDRERGY